MLQALPPFYHRDQDTMYGMIQKQELKFKTHISISDSAKDLITKVSFLKQLLNRDPNKRLGKNGGFDEIGKHKFFEGLNIDDLLNKKITADFIPQISGKLDVHNFDDEFTGEEIGMTVISDSAMNMLKKNKDQFEAFDNQENQFRKMFYFKSKN